MKINFIFYLLLFNVGFSQINEVNKRHSFNATFLDNPPKVDGNVLSDPIWESIPYIDEMIQSKPSFGFKASERTVIRVAFTNSNLYVSAICYDSDPDNLVISDSRRDSSLSDDDSFLFILDTYNDQQNGFLFGTNSSAMEYDAQIDNEGNGNRSVSRQQGGVIGGTNLNWDASWDVKSEKGDYGWSAEFAIPLKSLRFNIGKNQTWGINFQRNISKTSETAYWASLPLGFDIKRVSLAGKIDGIDLKNPKNLKIMPYVLMQSIEDKSVKDLDKTDLELGADIKYSITPGLTLDLTYNTDFAQAEVDKQQVNLDRFNLFFPEKRAFFLENAGQFSVGSPGEVDLFFSRRIGIGKNGSKVPIIGGSRISGKIGQTNIGFLSMFTDELEQSEIEKNNFTVARVNHNFNKSRSSLGAAIITRNGLGKKKEDHNKVVALDGVWGIGKKAKVTGFLSKSSTPGIDNKDHAFRLAANYDWDGWKLSAQYTEVGEGFNPEVGYLERSSFRKPELLIWKAIRLEEKRNLLELRPHISYRSYWNFDDQLVTKFLHIDNHWVWRSGFEIHTGLNLTKEWVNENFKISGVSVPVGHYNHSEFMFVIMTNANKKLSFRTRSVIGGYFGGKRFSNNASLNARIGNKFNSSISINHAALKLPNGNVNALLFGTNFSYSFTPKMFIQGLVQYNNLSNLFSLNARFGLLETANSGLFVVINIVKDEDLLDDLNNQTFTIKYTRIFDLSK